MHVLSKLGQVLVVLMKILDFTKANKALALLIFCWSNTFMCSKGGPHMRVPFVLSSNMQVGMWLSFHLSI